VTDRSRLLVEVSAGELIDKITILRIKAARIAVPAKLHNVRTELDSLVRVREVLPNSSQLDELESELQRVNERLWEIEDAIRDSEARKDFGPAFVELARAVYRTNDRRSDLKRAINTLLDSRLIEEKCYSAYPSG
jgi:chaperonin cofactor prefoldin